MSKLTQRLAQGIPRRRVSGLLGCYAWRRRGLRQAATLGALGLFAVSVARADGAPAVRTAQLTWSGPDQQQLLLSMSFRDVIDAEIQRKLTRGLPTTIVFTATLRREGSETPLSTTAQSCRVTWHVWEEAYRIELTRMGGARPPGWTTTTEGVLRRCAEVNQLVTATRAQIPQNVPLYLDAKIVVNPLSEDLLLKIKRWVSRPTGTSTAAPGDALFGTFTGLFMQRISEAEKVVMFRTRSVLPRLP